MSTTQTDMPDRVRSIHGAHLLDPNKSPSFRVASDQPALLQYGTGSVPVLQCNELIAIGQYTAYTTFGAANVLPPVWFAMPYAGILGLGLPPQARLTHSTWWGLASHIKGSSAPPPPFTISVPPVYADTTGGGNLTLGAVDSSLGTAPFLWAPLRPMEGGYTAWAIEVFSMRVDSLDGSSLQLCPGACTGDVDSGSSLLLLPQGAYAAFQRAVVQASNGTCQHETAFMVCHAQDTLGPAWPASLQALLPNISFTVAGRQEAAGGAHSAYEVLLTPRMYMCCGEVCGHVAGLCRVSVGVGGFGRGGFILGDTFMSHYVTAFHEEFRAIGIAPTAWGLPLRPSDFQLPHLPWYASPAVWLGGPLLLGAVLLAWRLGKDRWGGGRGGGPTSQAPGGVNSGWGSVPTTEV